MTRVSWIGRRLSVSSMKQLMLAAKACHPTTGGDVFRRAATSLTLRVSK
jgi:hypothetical protein